MKLKSSISTLAVFLILVALVFLFIKILEANERATGRARLQEHSLYLKGLCINKDFEGKAQYIGVLEHDDKLEAYCAFVDINGATFFYREGAEEGSLVQVDPRQIYLE